MTILVISNCQVFGVANCIESLTGIDATAIGLATFEKATDEDLDRWADAHDLVFAAPAAMSRLAKHRLGATAVVVPTIYFDGYHPDLIYVLDGDKKVQGPLGDYHSAIALAAFRRGMTADETVGLFEERTYRAAGYLDAWAPARIRLLSTLADAGLELEDRFYAWSRSGPFMHSVNHPRIDVLLDIAAAVLRKAGIPTEAPVAVLDNLLKYSVYPVYPEIGDQLGIRGSYRFRPPASSMTMGLEAFVAGSFEAYAAAATLAPRPAQGKLLARVEAALATSGEA